VERRRTAIARRLNWALTIQSIALNGQINFVGRLADGASKIDTSILYNSVATLRVVFAGNRAHFIAMNRAIAVNDLRPIINRVFRFSEVIEAFRYYEESRPFGKVVISHLRAAGFYEQEPIFFAEWRTLFVVSLKTLRDKPIENYQTTTKSSTLTKKFVNLPVKDLPRTGVLCETRLQLRPPVQGRDRRPVHGFFRGRLTRS
jgi:Zinc-binding dehydrogenase